MTFETIKYREESGYAEITLNRPERLNAFTAQSIHNARSAAGFAFQAGIGQIEDIKAGAVFHALGDALDVQAGALGVNQREFLQLLVGSQQIAFGALTQQASGFQINL